MWFIIIGDSNETKLWIKLKLWRSYQLKSIVTQKQIKNRQILANNIPNKPALLAHYKISRETQFNSLLYLQSRQNTQYKRNSLS